jgi:CBS domain-containing protein
MPARVVDAMVRHPLVWGLSTTVAQVNEAFLDDHLHAVLVVDGTGTLSTVIERADTEGIASNVPAVSIGRLHGRTIGPHVLLAEARRVLDAGRHRRLAVVDDDGVLLGLLCLKRSGRGFCADSDIAARRRGRLGLSHALEFGTRAASAEMRRQPVEPIHILPDGPGCTGATGPADRQHVVRGGLG